MNCQKCNSRLPFLRRSTVTCSGCGAIYVAERRLSLVTSIYGAAAFVIIPAGFLGPWNLGIKLILIPALYIIGGIYLGRRNVRWILTSKE